MKTQCEICNRTIEEHLTKQGKRLCFSCLTEEVTDTGAVSVFALKQPVQAGCALCEVMVSGKGLYPSPWGFICADCCHQCETQSGVSWDLVTVTSQKEWLVKANRQILGPYTSEEVEHLLRETRIVPLDEVARPAGRWQLLWDVGQFRTVLNEIRNKQVTRAEHEITAGTPTGTDGQTQDIDIMVENPFLRTEKLMEGVHEQVQAAQAKTVNEESRDLLKFYVSKDDRRVVQELKATKQGRIGVALGFILLVLGTISLIEFSRNRDAAVGVRDRSFQEYMSGALKAEKVGDFQKALTLYSEARTIRPNDPELLLHLAPMILIYDRQIIQAQRMFKQILDTESGANYQKAGRVGLGLIAVENREFDSAWDNFRKARDLDPEFIPAIADLAIVSFLKGDLQTAESGLLRALDKDKARPDGALVISLADVSIAQADSGEGKKKLADAHSLLDGYLSIASDYQQEALAADARVLSLMGKRSEAARKIETFLDADPEKPDLHIRDWAVYRGRASWGLLLENLKKVSNDLAATPRLRAALGLALYRGREKLDGAQSIEQALSQSPDDALLLALAGWVELKLSRREIAIGNIKQAALKPDAKFKLPHILQARLCFEEHDLDCAQRNWNIVLALDSRSVEALHGLAAIEWEKKNIQSALSYLRQGQGMDPNYIPLLNLDQEIQNSGAAQGAGQ